MIQARHLVLLALVLLGGVLRTPADKPDEFLMPRMQQNTYLSHAVDPIQFGFTSEQTTNGLSLVHARATLAPNQTARIHLSGGQIPVVRVRGRSQRMKTAALLDTSMPVSWMEFSISQKFAADFLGTEDHKIQYHGTYNIGDASAYAAVVPAIHIESVRIGNAPLFVRMAIGSIGPLARGITSPDIGLVIGYDLLQELEYIQFNSQSQLLQLSSTTPYTPDPEWLMTEAKIVAVKNQGLAVEGAILGQPTPIVLDFAGDYHFSRGDVKVSVTKQISLGDVVFRKVPTLILPTYDAPPRAGRRMLDEYIVTVCPKKGVVYFERFPE
jgi:hypothetical protein